MKKISKTSSTVKNRYNAKAYDQLPIRVKKGQKEVIQMFAEKQGESLNSFVVRAVRAQIERESPQTELSELDS